MSPIRPFRRPQRWLLLWLWWSAAPRNYNYNFPIPKSNFEYLYFFNFYNFHVFKFSRFFTFQNGAKMNPKNVILERNKLRMTFRFFQKMTHTNSGSSIRKKAQNPLIPSVLKEIIFLNFSIFFLKKNQQKKRTVSKIIPMSKITQKTISDA